MGHDEFFEFFEFVLVEPGLPGVRAYAHDLTVFFSVAEKDPTEVTSRDVLAFVSAQQRPRASAGKVVRISDGGAGCRR